jgi:hypothetical protein
LIYSMAILTVVFFYMLVTIKVIVVYSYVISDSLYKNIFGKM